MRIGCEMHHATDEVGKGHGRKLIGGSEEGSWEGKRIEGERGEVKKGVGKGPWEGDGEREVWLEIKRYKEDEGKSGIG